MTTVADLPEDYSSPPSSFEDMFMFSSPATDSDQLAIFSPSDSGLSDFDSEDEFGIYDQKSHVGKISCASLHRQQRHAATVAVPTIEISSSRKLPLIVKLSDFCEQRPACPNNLVADVSRSSAAQQQPLLSVHPSSVVSTNSRIKSTTPDIKLLFSLFDVLDNDCESDSPSPASSSCSSSISSPSSPTSYADRHSSPEVTARSPARVPDVDAPKFAVVPNLVYRPISDSIQWTSPAVSVRNISDRATILSSFADMD
jgi:hypothetical protein